MYANLLKYFLRKLINWEQKDNFKHNVSKSNSKPAKFQTDILFCG